MNTELELACTRVLAAVLNGGYQGLLLTAVIWLGLKLFPRANAATRHAVWFATILVVALLPAVHFLALPGSPRGSETATVDLSFSANGGAEGQNGDLAASREEHISWRNNRDTFMSELDPDPTLSTTGVLAETGNEDLLPGENSSARLFGAARAMGERTLEAMSAARAEWLLALPDWVAPVLVGLWILVALSRLGKLASQCLVLHKWKTKGRPAGETACQLFEKLRLELGIRRKARLVLSSQASAPMAAGFLRPAVLLPMSLCEGASPGQLEQVLRHELAHLQRRDDWSNLIQQTIKAAFCFHPAVWWISPRLTMEREIACDDHVLSAIQTPRAYALFLTEFAGQMKGRDWTAAPAAWTNKSQLTERINMILDSKRNSSPRLGRASTGVLTAAAVLLALVALHAGPRLAFASEQRADTTVTVATDKQQNVSINQDETTATAVIAGAASAKTVTAGPRAKAGTAPEPATLTITAPAPSPAPRPVVAIAGAPPSGAVRALVVAPATPPAPADAPPPRRTRNADENSLERRLDRLERMVEALTNREKMKGPPGGYIEFRGRGPDAAKLAEDAAKFGEKMRKSPLNNEDLAKIREHAKMEAERAAHDAQRGWKDAEKGWKDAEKSLKEAQKGWDGAHLDKLDHQLAEIAAARGSGRQQLEAQRRALEAQRRSLEKQMASIEKQMERLEEQQKKVEAEDSERGKPRKRQESDDKGPKEVTR